MATTLVSSVGVDVSAVLAAALDLSTPGDSLAYPIAHDFADGAGDDQANQVWHDRRTVAAVTADNLDLAGVLYNPLGELVTLARVKAIIIFNRSTQCTLQLQAGASNGWAAFLGGTTPHLKIEPGGSVVLVAPKAAAWPVTAGSADVLTVYNSHASVAADYDIIIIGAKT
jgi:hypothetical protein